MKMNWITIENNHINLDNITGFKWSKNDQNLHLFDNATKRYSFYDPDRKWYRQLCNFIGMNMVEEKQK